eukprot:15143069-Alexandrium_andersonii.AAC.1
MPVLALARLPSANAPTPCPHVCWHHMCISVRTRPERSETARALRKCNGPAPELGHCPPSLSR